MKRLFAFSAVALLAGCGSNAPTPPPSPTVLVTTIPARQGSLPATVVAYGSVGPALNGTMTFSEAQPGQVTALAVAPGMAVHAGQTLATFVTAPASRSGYLQAVTALAAARKQEASTAQLLSQQLRLCRRHLCLHCHRHHRRPRRDRVDFDLARPRVGTRGAREGRVPELARRILRRVYGILRL